MRLQQERLLRVYRGKGVTVLSSDRQTLGEIVKKIVRLIYSNRYEEFDMNSKLNEIKEKGRCHGA